MKIASLYARLYGYFKDNYGIRLRGLNWISRFVVTERVLTVKGAKIFYDPQLGRSYGRLIGGEWNEPETICFLNKYLQGRSNVAAIDIGANIGEYVAYFGMRKEVSCIDALEPQELCQKSLNATMEMQPQMRRRVRKVLVSDECESVEFEYDNKSSNSSRVLKKSSMVTASSVQADKIDRFGVFEGDSNIWICDVEGHELEVFKGARETIARIRPTIVFEYNDISRSVYRIEQIQNVLPAGYCIWSIGEGGHLSPVHERAWNCVAVPE